MDFRSNVISLLPFQVNIIVHEKAGSTTIKRRLRRVLEDCYPGEPWEAIREREVMVDPDGRIPPDWPTYAVVRHPYARAVSMYQSKVRDGLLIRDHTDGFLAGMSLKEFITELHRRPDPTVDRHFRSQTSRAGRYPWATLLRLEELNRKSDPIRRALGFRSWGEPLNATGEAPELTRECQLMVYQRFASDFDLWEAAACP